MKKNWLKTAAIIFLFGMCALMVLFAKGGEDGGQRRFEAIEVRWVKDQPFVVLEARLPARYFLFPRTSTMQTEKVMLQRDGRWQFDERPYDPSVPGVVVEQIYPARGKRGHPRVTRFLVRVPEAEAWRLEIDSFETWLIGYPIVRRPIDKEFHWRSDDLPGVAAMRAQGLASREALWAHVRTNRPAGSD